MTTKVYTLFARNPDHIPGPRDDELEDDGSVFEEECFASSRAEAVKHFEKEGFDTDNASIVERDLTFQGY